MIHHDHPGNATFRYCPQCGRELDSRDRYGQTRPVCPNCDYVHFVDPKLVVATLAHRDGKVLLHRRAMEPGRGKWTFPSGFVDGEEVVEEAAIREAKEETNADVAIERLFGVYSEAGERIVLIVYEGTVTNADISVADPNESTEVGFFDPAGLPDMAFARDRDIIRRWAKQSRSEIPKPEARRSSR